MYPVVRIFWRTSQHEIVLNVFSMHLQLIKLALLKYTNSPGKDNGHLIFMEDDIRMSADILHVNPPRYVALLKSAHFV